MYYITQMQKPSFELGIKEGEKVGRKEGKKEGKKEGELKGYAKMLSILIAKQFNSQVRRELPRLRKLKSKDLMELGEIIFGFHSLDSIHEWIKQRKQHSKK